MLVWNLVSKCVANSILYKNVPSTVHVCNMHDFSEILVIRKRNCLNFYYQKWAKTKNRSSTDMDNTPIQEIDIIFRGPYKGSESRNAQRNYGSKVKDVPKASYIINNQSHRVEMFSPLASPKKMRQVCITHIVTP